VIGMKELITNGWMLELNSTRKRAVDEASSAKAAAKKKRAYQSEIQVRMFGS